MDYLQVILTLIYFGLLLGFFAHLLKIQNSKAFKICAIIEILTISVIACFIGYNFANARGLIFSLIPMILALPLILPVNFRFKKEVSLSAFFTANVIFIILLINLTENTFKLIFENPSYLWLILIVMPVILFWVHSLAVISPRQNIFSLFLRLLVCILVVIAFANPRMVREQNRLTVIFVVDRSASMPKELSYHWFRNYINPKLDLPWRDLGEDLYGIVLFAGKPVVYMFPSKGSIQGFEPEDIQRHSTDISSAIRQALALFPEDSRKRIVLLSDGNENEGDLFKELSIALHQDISVDVVTFESDKRVFDARIERLSVPDKMLADTPFEVKLVVHSTSPAKARIFISCNGVAITEPIITELKAGNNYPRIPLQVLNKEGFYEYSAQIEIISDEKGNPLTDCVPENNFGRAFTVVKGTAKIMLVYGDTEQENKSLIQALLQGGKAVDVRSDAELPRNNAFSEFSLYDAVILSNVSSFAWSNKQMLELRSAVHNAGVGLIILGGDKSYGAGGYQNQPIVEAFPLDMDIKEKRVIPSGALVIIMHTCEMPQGNYYAKVIAETTLDSLSADDEFGIVLYRYSSRKAAEWLFPLQKVADNRSTMVRKIQNAPPEDMPSFDPAFALAYKALMESNAGSKHCIIISDGDPSISGNAYSLVRSAFEDAGVTTSGVTIFPHTLGGIPTMQRVVQLGGPMKDWEQRHWLIDNQAGISTLPKIFTKEAARVKQTMLQNREIKAFEREPVEFLKYLRKGSDAGTLKGFTLTSRKPGASVPLIVDDEDDWPLLAYWQYGLGKAVCWTSDMLDTGWGNTWVAGENLGLRVRADDLSEINFAKFINDIVAFAMRQATTNEQVTMRTELRGNRGVFTLNLVDERGRYITLPDLTVNLISPSAKAEELKMRLIRPGELEGEFRANEEGVYKIIGSYSAVDGRLGLIESGLSVPYPVEYKSFGVNERVLREIVNRSNGNFARSKLRNVTILDSSGTQEFLSEFEFGEDYLEDETGAIILDARGFPVIYDPSKRDVQPQYSYMPVWFQFCLLASILIFFDVFVRRVQLNFSSILVLLAKIPLLNKFFKPKIKETSEEIEMLKTAKSEARDEYAQRLKRLGRKVKITQAKDDDGEMIVELKKAAKVKIKESQKQEKLNAKLEKQKLKLDNKEKEKSAQDKDETMDSLQKAKEDALKKRKK